MSLSARKKQDPWYKKLIFVKWFQTFNQASSFFFSYMLCFIFLGFSWVTKGKKKCLLSSIWFHSTSFLTWYLLSLTWGWSIMMTTGDLSSSWGVLHNHTRTWIVLCTTSFCECFLFKGSMSHLMAYVQWLCILRKSFSSCYLHFSIHFQSSNGND